MACSFQKEESVLIDMLMRIEPSARVFTIDTGVLFPETYEVWREVEERYGLQRRGRGRDPAERHPLERVELLRHPQGRRPGARARRHRRLDHGHPARAVAHPRGAHRRVEWDEPRGVWKFNPLADWTDRDVWSYVNEHDLPYNPLHDRGLRVDRLRPLHAARETAATAAGPGRTRPSAVCTFDPLHV